MPQANGSARARLQNRWRRSVCELKYLEQDRF